ncbi:twin-arginine translocase subunit TatC [Metabacillus sp. KIGAM252]|uniref:Sec-independent protein translocase protein TatC n=1 Tax=Metabacillus flavus TaxID=2823519 RepID=A0ABS5L9S8_9BACI|nr:twin-arginine translocase subunit TatC [Metabacillus flavus]MBS2967480.1 twin-arginine translocase subunit TatC [Metabacillus flavus]
MNEREMSVYEHIEELRKRILVVAIFFILALIAGFFLAKPIILFLQQTEEAKNLTLNAFRMSDPLFLYMKFAVIIALILISPLILFQLWSFISPGLYEKERIATLSYIPLSVLLFLGGISFSYFVLFPFVVRFMTNFSADLGISQVIGINEYFQFLFELTLPFGLLFQLPVVIMFLTRLGIVTPMFLRKVRKYAYFLLLVVAGLITPPELISQVIVLLPLIILYEISIVVSQRAYRKSLKIQMEEEAKEQLSP